MNLAVRKPQSAASPLMPEDIRARLDEARAKMAKLVADQMTAAEDISPEGDKKYQAVCAAMTEASAEIARYELALAGIERRAAVTLKNEQLAEQAALRQRVADVLDKRGAAAEAFSKAIGEAVRALHELAGLSDRALMAWPGPQPGGGVALGNVDLLQLASAEMYRQGHTVVLTGRPPSLVRQKPSLPPPKCPTLQQLDMPESITPLVDAIAAANAFGKSILEGKAT